jgi:hypothetical protein
MTEPTYKVSFINGNPGFVVCADNADDLEKNIREALPIFKRFKTAVDTYHEKQENDATPPPQEPEKCSVHGTPKIWKTGVSKAGKPYAFWACPTKNADGSFCKG